MKTVLVLLMSSCINVFLICCKTYFLIQPSNYLTVNLTLVPLAVNLTVSVTTDEVKSGKLPCFQCGQLPGATTNYPVCGLVLTHSGQHSTVPSLSVRF